MLTRSDCLALDVDDPLGVCRQRFSLPEGVVYLDGNSLGPVSAAVPDRVAATVAGEWGGGLIRSWNAAGWVDLSSRVGERIARLIGAGPGTVMVGDSTSVNLYKAVEAARRLRPGRRFVVTDSGNFPSDLYVLQGVCSAAGLELEVVAPEAVISAICDDTAIVALTEVDYRTGRRHDLARITAATHAAGAVAVWDLAHSVGAFPLEAEAAGVDFAVGCGYKYLNGGPGAPAFLYVAPSHRHDWRNPITGWFGHARPFAFEPVFDPAEGIDRAAIGTPPILSLVALDAALDVFDEVDMEQVRVKSLALTDLFIELIDERLGDLEVVTPREHSARGSQVSVRHPDGYPMMQALIARGVIGDFRAPDIMRFGVAPLYVRYVDVYDAVEELVQLVKTGEWRRPEFAVRQAVT